MNTLNTNFTFEKVENVLRTIRKCGDSYRFYENQAYGRTTVFYSKKYCCLHVIIALLHMTALLRSKQKVVAALSRNMESCGHKTFRYVLTTLNISNSINAVHLINRAIAQPTSNTRMLLSDYGERSSEYNFTSVLESGYNNLGVV